MTNRDDFKALGDAAKTRCEEAVESDLAKLEALLDQRIARAKTEGSRKRALSAIFHEAHENAHQSVPPLA